MSSSSVPAMASTNGEKEEWQVKVFRRTMSRGWEMYYNPEEDSTITAAPRKGCVEVKKLRIRIHLCQNSNNDSTKDPKKDSDSDEKIQKANTVVVRRMDTVLLSTRKGGAVVLKFLNIGEAASFSDRLVYLNAELIPNQPNIPDFLSLNHHSNIMPQMNYEAKRPYFQEKREDAMSTADDNTRMSKHRKTSCSTDESSITNSNSSNPQVAAVAQKRNNVISYIVRLLHDDSFLHFVNDMESSLKEMPDCAKILSAVGSSSNSTTSDVVQGSQFQTILAGCNAVNEKLLLEENADA